jgi:hypothetical protein
MSKTQTRRAAVTPVKRHERESRLLDQKRSLSRQKKENVWETAQDVSFALM